MSEHVQSAWSIRIPGISRNLSQKEVDVIKSKVKETTEAVVSLVAPAADMTAHAVLSQTVRVLSKAADGVITAADYVKGLDEPIAKRVRMYQLAKEMLG